MRLPVPQSSNHQPPVCNSEQFPFEKINKDEINEISKLFANNFLLPSIQLSLSWSEVVKYCPTIAAAAPAGALALASFNDSI